MGSRGQTIAAAERGPHLGEAVRDRDGERDHPLEHAGQHDHGEEDLPFRVPVRVGEPRVLEMEEEGERHLREVGVADGLVEEAAEQVELVPVVDVGLERDLLGPLPPSVVAVDGGEEVVEVAEERGDDRGAVVAAFGHEDPGLRGGAEDAAPAVPVQAGRVDHARDRVLLQGQHEPEVL